MTYLLLYKPFGYLSQFTREVEGQLTLADLQTIPEGLYPVGRLDKDSEGLLLLTDDKKLNHRLLNPKHSHWRTYLVQVEGIPDPRAVDKLKKGVKIRINKKDYTTKPARARLIAPPEHLPERNPPVRFRKTVPDSWLELQLTEGKNRQVRRMCAKVGYPVLRLLRTRMVDLELGELQPGELRELSRETLYRKLRLE